MEGEQLAPLAQTPSPMQVFSDPEVSGKILKVSSKISTDLIPVRGVSEETGKEIEILMPVPTKYKELLTEDASTAFCDPQDQSVMRSLEMLCSQIKSFGDSFGYKKDEKGNPVLKHGVLVKNMDLSEAYNLVADYHNSLLVSSKSTGEAARTAKSQYYEQKQRGQFETREIARRKKFLGLF